LKEGFPLAKKKGDTTTGTTFTPAGKRPSGAVTSQCPGGIKQETEATCCCGACAACAGGGQGTTNKADGGC